MFIHLKGMVRNVDIAPREYVRATPLLTTSTDRFTEKPVAVRGDRARAAYARC